MKETSIGNRESKSIITSGDRGYKSAIIVKEQRVDGSWQGVTSNPCLRYTLMAFERNSQLGVLSNQININRFYSSKVVVPKCTDSLLKNATQKMDPWFVTGFVDAEGSFLISIFKDKDYKTGWRVKLNFCITLHKKDKVILEDIQFTLGAGRIYKHDELACQWIVSSKEDFIQIIKHFDKYKLLTQKQADYELWKKAFNLIQKIRTCDSSRLRKNSCIETL
jgi:hypothetical protein